eukprot:2115802-Prymnesium_polylepis.1
MGLLNRTLLLLTSRIVPWAPQTSFGLPNRMEPMYERYACSKELPFDLTPSALPLRRCKGLAFDLLLADEQDYLGWQLHHDALRGLVSGLFFDPRLVQGDAQRHTRYCIKRLREPCDPCSRIAIHASASGNLTGKRRRLARLLNEWETRCKAQSDAAVGLRPRLPECEQGDRTS